MEKQLGTYMQPQRLPGGIRTAVWSTKTGETINPLLNHDPQARPPPRAARQTAAQVAAAGIFSIKDERGIFSATLSIGRDEAVDVFDQSQIPQDYLREIPAKYEADKALIKKAINDGFEVPGASIIKKDRLTIK